MSWQLHDEEGLLEFCAFICAGWIWLTIADRCGMLQCLLRIVRLTLLLGVVDGPLSKPEGDRQCLEPEGLDFPD